MKDAYNLGVSNGLAPVTIQAIQQKASTGEAMQAPTAQKQVVYDAYQNYYKGEIAKKAQAGQALANPNQWKNDMYTQAVQQQTQGAQVGNASNQMLQQLTAPLQQAQQNPQSFMDIEAFMAQSQTDSTAKMQAIQQFLEQSAKSQIEVQQAQLGLARDQQVAEIEKTLQQAVANGEMSIREAEQQYAVAKEQINQQAYVDSEITSLAAQNRGIQNSAQMIGLMQGDQARQGSLLNQNVTTRDNQINAINNQLAQMEYNAGIDKSLANAQYNYGLAGAQAQINSELMNNLANLSYEEFARLQAQQTGFQTLGLQQQFNRENMSTDQLYALQQAGLNQQFGLENMGTQQLYEMQQMAQNQNYTQQNMQTQQNFDIEKLGVQQKYTLEQMAKSFGYDLEKLSVQQQYTLAQMAQSFGYDMSLQSSQQSWQSGENALDRNFELEIQQMRQNHDLSMLTEQQRIDLQNYDIELARKLRSVTPGTEEYHILQEESNFALDQMMKENSANFAAEIGATELASLLEKYPKEFPDLTNQKDVDQYNATVESINKQIEKLVGTESAQQYIREWAKGKGKTEEETTGFIDWIVGTIKKTPAGWVGEKIGNALFTP